MKIKYNTLIVKDIQESARFYTEILKLKKIEEYDIPNKFSMAMFSDGDNIIELIENKEEPKISSIGFEVDSLDNYIEELEKKNIELLSKPLEKGDFKVATFYDPNGLLIVVSEKRTNE